MEQNPQIIINDDAEIISVTEAACAFSGLPPSMLVKRHFRDLLNSENRDRFDKELLEIVEDRQQTSRFNGIIVGLDCASRAFFIFLKRLKNNLISIELTPDTVVGIHLLSQSASISESRRLLPLGRRISSICRRAKSQKELLADTMAVISEVTSSICAAAIEWGGAVSDWPIVATCGDFNREFLKGVFRSSVIGRLARGDVIVKDALQDGSSSNHSLILIPTMASHSPEGVIILYVQGYSVMTAEELQSLGLLGEIIGLGLHSFAATKASSGDYQSRAADVEATIALGRLSAGLAHEINNAVTVLRNNTEQIYEGVKKYGTSNNTNQVFQDSIRAVEIIKDLTDALRSFAPEETRETEEVDLIRVIDMVISSVRYYAKRGINVSKSYSRQKALWVKCRSHYLIRSLFLIFVELVESALTSGKILMVNISLEKRNGSVDFTIMVSAGPVNIPSVLLSQLEKDGVLARLVSRSGSKLIYEVNKDNLSLMLSLPTVSTLESRMPSMMASSVVSKPSRRGTILIVDDEPAIIRSTRRILEKKHDVLAAGTAEEALEIIKNNAMIDILLLDVFMPGMSGLEMAEHLYKQNPDMARRIVFITGGASDKEVAKYASQIKAPIIEKPLNIELLNMIIADMLT